MDYKDEAGRLPIRLNRNAFATIRVYSRTNNEIDLYWDELDEEPVLYKEAARQFIAQLEGEWCINFLRALSVELDEIIDIE